jgi:hypothetical protein
VAVTAAAVVILGSIVFDRADAQGKCNRAVTRGAGSRVWHVEIRLERPLIGMSTALLCCTLHAARCTLQEH